MINDSDRVRKVKEQWRENEGLAASDILDDWPAERIADLNELLGYCRTLVSSRFDSDEWGQAMDCIGEFITARFPDDGDESTAGGD